MAELVARIDGSSSVILQQSNVLTGPSPAPLFAHLESQNVEFMQFAFRWMNCLLMREISVQNTTRMWDTYLVRHSFLPVLTIKLMILARRKALMRFHNSTFTCVLHFSLNGARSFERWISRQVQMTPSSCVPKRTTFLFRESSCSCNLLQRKTGVTMRLSCFSARLLS
jgi:hypothetical protein